jgi:hypothetical protein
MTIYSTPPGLTPRWRVEQYGPDPGQVRFVKWGQTTKLLDQVARWAGGRWDPSRWVPQSPQVPKQILMEVTAEMVRREVAL